MLCGAILPFSQAHAIEPVVATFGGFSPGKKFTLTVQQVTSSQSVGTRTKPKAPIPPGIPLFRKGQKITFVVGKKGELQGPQFTIPFISASTNINSYAKLPNSRSPSPNIASVGKSPTGKPIGAALVFYLYRITGSNINSLSINQVGYVFQ